MRQKDRPKISIYIASSIDGYIARKEGGLDWLEYGHTGYFSGTGDFKHVGTDY